MGWKVHSLRARHGGLCDMCEIVLEQEEGPSLALDLSTKWGDGEVQKQVQEALAGTVAVSRYRHARDAAAEARADWQALDGRMRHLQEERERLLEEAPLDLPRRLAELDQAVAALAADLGRASECKAALEKAALRCRHVLLNVTRALLRDASQARMAELQAYKIGLGCELAQRLSELLDDALAVELCLKQGALMGQLGGDPGLLVEVLADAHQDAPPGPPAEVSPEGPPDVPAAEVQSETQTELQTEEVASCPA